MASLHACIVKKFGYASMSAEMISVFAMSVTYLIKQLKAFDYQKNMHQHCQHTSFSAKDFRLHLQCNSEFNLFIKLFVCNTFRNGAPATRRQLFRSAEAHKVRRSDAETIYSLYKECTWFRQEVDAFCSDVDYEGRHTNIIALERQFSEMYPALLKYAKNFTYRKLRFLYEANNETRDVYTSELLEKAARAFYTIVPTNVSELHLLNKLKQTIDNHGLNIINRETSQKAGRIISGVIDKNGVRGSAQLLCVSFSQATAQGAEEKEDPEEADDSFNRFEMQFSISQILSRLEKTSRRYRMLMILMGNDDAEFTSWLVRNGHCRSGQDHEDVQQKLKAADFNVLLCQFLNFSERKAAQFMSKISALLPQGADYVTV